MDSKEKSLLFVRLARDRRAKNLTLLDLRGFIFYADYFVICSGRSDRQVQAIAEYIQTKLREYKMRPRSVDGVSAGRWVLMDYGDVIVHIFQQPVRDFYDLEGLWSDAPQVPLPPDPEESEEWEDSFEDAE